MSNFKLKEKIYIFKIIIDSFWTSLLEKGLWLWRYKNLQLLRSIFTRLCRHTRADELRWKLWRPSWPKTTDFPASEWTRMFGSESVGFSFFNDFDILYFEKFQATRSLKLQPVWMAGKLPIGIVLWTHICLTELNQFICKSMMRYFTDQLIIKMQSKINNLAIIHQWWVRRLGPHHPSPGRVQPGSHRRLVPIERTAGESWFY